MKAYLQIVLLAIFFIGINGQLTSCEEFGSQGQDADTCRMYPTSEDFTHCCYVQYEGIEGDPGYQGCKELSDDQYENVKRYKNYLKNTYSNVKIKCSGEFLTYSLFALLALLF